MTQDQERKKRPSGDEGAAYTAAMMAVVKGMRAARGWSAERLATEMAAAGVPWTRDTVVNLENGRRKNLHVHEAMALAWILDAASPLDVLVPYSRSEPFPVTPAEERPASLVRAWFRDETGPPRTLSTSETRALEWREELRDILGEPGAVSLPPHEVEALIDKLVAGRLSMDIAYSRRLT